MKPATLREGNTAGIISPSWGGGAAYPHRVERGVEYLAALDFGHTSPVFTLPVGCRAVIDAGREQFEIVEVVVV